MYKSGAESTFKRNNMTLSPGTVRTFKQCPVKQMAGQTYFSMKNTKFSKPKFDKQDEDIDAAMGLRGSDLGQSRENPLSQNNSRDSSCEPFSVAAFGSKASASQIQ